MPKATRPADPICLSEPSKVTAQRPELEQLEESDTSDSKVGLHHSFKVVLADAQVGEGVFLTLSVSPSAQVVRTSEASVEPSMSGEGHAEDHPQGPQQKRKRVSDLQDKGTYLLEGYIGPGM